MRNEDILLICAIIPASVACFMVLFTKYDPLPLSVASLAFLYKLLILDDPDPPSFKKLYHMMKQKFKEGVEDYRRWRNHSL